MCISGIIDNEGRSACPICKQKIKFIDDIPACSQCRRLLYHGFLILENLKQKTGIPFRPLEMDLATLRACFQAGHYRPLTAEDKKAMQSPLLAPYREILDFMLQHNCKVEQESLAAMDLDAPSQNENM